MDDKTINHNFSYHKPKDEETIRNHEIVRDECKRLANIINTFVVDSREKSLAITKLEECMMWANAGVARCSK